MMRGFIPALIYLGFGTLFHAMFVGPQFDWSSAWTWGLLVGWPIFLGAAILLAGAVIATIVFLWELATGRL